jgi:hypothetical protein
MCSEIVSNTILSHAEHNNDFRDRLCRQYLRIRLHFWAKIKTQDLVKEKRDRSLRKKMAKLLKWI